MPFKGILVVLILTLSLERNSFAQEFQKPKNYDKGLACCSGDNVFPRSCPNRTETSLKCEKYMIDPFMIPEDDFEVTEDGELSIHESDVVIEKGEFCVTYYEPIKNESRYVAFACFTADDNVSSYAVFFMRGLLTLTSVCFIVLTLYVYRVIRSKDTQDRVTCYCLGCLAFFFLFLGCVQIFAPEYMVSSNMCVPLGENINKNKQCIL